MTINVAILGCSGRMGKNLLQSAYENDHISLVGGTVRAGSSLAGVDLGEFASLGKLNIEIATSLDTPSIAQADVLIDFTTIESTLEHVKWCQQHGKAIVIGTTGFNETELSQIKAASQNTPVIVAPNTSVGVNLLFKLLEMTSKVIGDSTDIEIFEAHHRFKKDAPSGTAMKMGEVIADTLGRDLEKVAVYGREGITEERDPKTIGFATVRAGDIIGEHTAFFADLGERIEITHKATTRMTFANGAMRAANWLAEQPNGFYDMQDVLGLK